MTFKDENGNPLDLTSISSEGWWKLPAPAREVFLCGALRALSSFAAAIIEASRTYNDNNWSVDELTRCLDHTFMTLEKARIMNDMGQLDGWADGNE